MQHTCTLLCLRFDTTDATERLSDRGPALTPVTVTQTVVTVTQTVTRSNAGGAAKSNEVVEAGRTFSW